MAEHLAPRPRPQLRVLAGGGAQGPQSYSDAELFEGIAEGNPRIASALYRRLLPDVEVACLRVLGRQEWVSSRDEASAPSFAQEELVRTSFARLVATLSRRRYPEVCSLSTWASALSVLQTLAFVRARCRASNLDRTATLRRDVEALRLCLAELQPARADVVVLHELMELPITEIAPLLGSSVAVVRSRLVRARRELRVALAAKLGAALPSGKLPDPDELFSVWRSEAPERARSLSIGGGARRALAQALVRVARQRRRARYLGRFGIISALLAAALAVGFAIWFVQRELRGEDHAAPPAPEPPVLLQGVIGEVWLSDAEGNAVGTAALQEGYGVRTKQGWAELAFPSGAQLSLSEHGRIALLSAGGTESLFLGAGRVEVEVPPELARGRFAVETPDTHLTSSDAEFTVAVELSDEGATTRVGVRSGSVWVLHAGRELELGPGEAWPLAAETARAGGWQAGSGVD